ncbi:hypothetical protein [Thermococcus sp. MV5]|nr:hypothetical protein [Thermococcus sp. MV5]
MALYFPLLARPLPRGMGYARGGGWRRFKYSKEIEYDGLVTAVRLDSP